MSAEHHVTATDITWHYGKKQALAIERLDFDSDSMTCLLGPNGSGKSTLFGLLSTARPAPSGTITYNGSPLRGSELTAFRRRLGWLPQDFLPPRGFTVDRFLRYAAWLKNVPRSERKRATGRVAELTGLSEYRSNDCGELSWGLKRRVGIAQALINDPYVCLLDEPTAGLDPQQRDQTHDALNSLVGECAVVVSTHLLEDVVAFGGRIVVLGQGSIVFSGDAMAMTGTDSPSMGDLSDAYGRLLPERNDG